MYTCLWINAPKEAYELPNHRFDGELPSYVKRPVMYRYLKEYHLKYGQAAKVKFNCKVENVTNTAKDKFSVTWVDTAQSDYPQMETFDYVVVAVGHFSVPNDPIFTNEEKFTGKIIHAHDYRDGRLYKDKRVLLVGGSYSAEDIALQCWKFGAKYSHITHKNPNRMGFQWPKGVVETETFLKDFDGNKVIFEDGSSEEYDYVIKCTGKLKHLIVTIASSDPRTIEFIFRVSLIGSKMNDPDQNNTCFLGYIHHFPFMSEDILLKTENSFCPENLYQQCVLLKNPKVFYMGMANQALSMTIFQHQSFYIRGMTHNKDSIRLVFT